MVQTTLLGNQPQPDIKEQLKVFLEEWNSDSPTVGVQTSGSTGIPKQMQVEKERMRNSALLTCSFLGLQKGDTAFLCMPLRYIAGKMVVVRSLVAGLKLIAVQPSGHPLQGMKQPPVFAAMTPMQVYNSLSVPQERECLRHIRHLIIGGGAIDKTLADGLRDFPHCVWSTYGMTETLSHIALRRLNGPEATEWYTPFPSVKVSLSPQSTLVIEAPLVNPQVLTTHDVAELDAQGRFRILGRTDNIINTGGIKVQIEEVEERLKPGIEGDFAITSVPDMRLGEAITLLYKSPQPEEAIASFCTTVLPPYWHPRHIYRVAQIPHTETGKISRAEAKKLAVECLHKQ